MKHISFWVIVYGSGEHVGMIAYRTKEEAEERCKHPDHAEDGDYVRKVTINIREGRNRGPVGEMEINRGGGKR